MKLPVLPFVRSGITRGVSANAAYREYRATAQSIGEDVTTTRRQDFLRLYSQTLNLRGLAQQAVGMPRDIVPDQVEPRDTKYARGYGQWVMVFQRTRGGEDFLPMPFLIKSNEPITPAEAEARALSYVETQADDYDRVLLGVSYAGTERFQPNVNL